MCIVMSPPPIWSIFVTHFCHSPKVPFCSFAYRASPPSQLLATTDLVYFPFIVLSFPKSYINRIIREVIFSDFFHLAQCFWDSSLLLHIPVVHPFLCPSTILMYKCTSPLSNKSFSIVFSHSVACFILVRLSFKEHFNIDSFSCLYLKVFVTLGHKDFPPMFPSRSFMALWLASRMAINFDWCFVHGMRHGLKFVILPGDGCQAIETSFVK